MNNRTYISLFSSAGVGCYGFKLNGYRCIATNELLKQRIAVQRANRKCEYDTGYICGDITKEETHTLLFAEIENWKANEGLEQVDVVFATPPCQGMSTVNYKKNDHEQIRNSLVVQAIKLIKEIHPKVFVFENVRAFLKSVCTDISGTDMLIRDSILLNLADDYNIYYQIINFKDFGIPSSRPRTIVIGTSKKIKSISPLNLFPTRKAEITLRDAIGSFPSLEFGEKDKKDPFHFARPFPEHEIEWISDLKEGQSAFDKPLERQPYKIDKNGNRVILKGSYMGNKYRRLFWDKPGACIATRNDVLSSQDTIHPADNRVLSIRELMRLMTIPDSFQWTDEDGSLTVENSTPYLAKNEMNIRHCIGEAVPTEIIRCISSKINDMLDYAENQETASPNNYYVKNRSILRDQSDIFDEILSLPQEMSNVSIYFKSLSGFKNYAIQLTSYYAQADKIDFIVSKDINSKDLSSIKKDLEIIQFGDNVSISFENTEQQKKYTYIIDDSIKTGECEPEQLSLFEIMGV